MNSHESNSLFPRFLRSALLALLGCLLALPVYGQDEGRRGRGRGNWDPAQFLDRLDRDDNGILDQRELNGRMRDYVRDQLGMDVSRPLSVQAVLNRVVESRETKAREERLRERDASRRVPKFGESVDLPPVPGFGISTDSADGPAGSLEDSYEESIVKAVRAYLERFDEDKNGVLSEDEWRPIRRMLGEGADSDDNGSLGELELAEALKNRRDRQMSEGADRGRGRGRGRGGESEENAAPQPTRPSRPTPPTTSRPPTSRTMDSRYSNYVTGVFDKYDTDNNGQLSPEERQEVKLNLRDTDGDGQISRSEAMQSLSERSSQNAESESPQQERGRERRGRDNDEPSRRGAGGSEGDMEIGRDIRGFGRTQMPSMTRSNSEMELRRNGASGEFMELDKNEDGQIDMSEYARPSEWDDDKLQKFRSMDLNDDGLITVDEFGGGN